jgi:hypothetical protein
MQRYRDWKLRAASGARDRELSCDIDVRAESDASTNLHHHDEFGAPLDGTDTHDNTNISRQLARLSY